VTRPRAATAPGSRRREVRTPIGVGAGVLAATVLLAVRDPHAGGYGICPVLALTGMACAGCGGLRAVHDLAVLDVSGAWAMNPLAVVAAPVLVAAWAVWLVRAASGRPAWHPPGRLLVGVLVVVVLFSVLRNVPALVPLLGPAGG
jgi:hypothetical protein